MTSTSPMAAAVHGSFALDDIHELTAALASLLEACDPPPKLLALGEPTHGEPAFPRLRNRILRALVEHGFRSIAVETDQIAALDADAFVRGGAGTLDQVMAEGFSHGFGQLDANRELVAWMRAYNQGRPAAEQLAFYGFDAPLETTSAPSPRRYLRHLHGYLTEHLGPDSFLHGHTDLERLLGDDEHWSDPAALTDAARSIGASTQATRLRAVTDDLLTTLHAQVPRLVAASSMNDWQQAEMHGKAARGLLRYHAQLAEATSPAARVSRLLAVRDTLMVENIRAVRAREQHRGPTLLFAHNRHLQRNLSAVHLPDMDLEWFSAGAITATLLGDGYTFIASSLGTSAALGLHSPPVNTFEAAMHQAPYGCALFDAHRLREALGASARALHVRTDVRPEQGYFPLDAATLEHCDAVLHIASASGHTAR
ncbi:erythromycin esterase family protein [Streptomyces sp. NPDC006430]|uniref:erythromycin esterase family protein n=1 Tax=Streptomyces sp. NPDC006430 TaxID=3154299 RepID=UPI0033A446D4